MNARRCLLLLLSMIGLWGSLQGPGHALAVEVLVPNSGVLWTAGESHEILWASTAGGEVSIEWSPNAGELYWLTIEATAPNSESYLWLVPNVPTRNALVRITELSTAESDTSDTTFAIAHIPIEQSVGHLYLSADPAAYVHNLDVEPLVEFAWYVVTDIDFSQTPDVPGLGAWEASVAVPPEIIVTQHNLMPPGSFDVGPGDNNWAVGTGACLETVDMPYALVHYRGLLLTLQVDLELTLGPSTPSSIDPPNAPAWAGCGITGGLWPFPLTSALSINRTTATPVAATGSTTLHQNNPNPFNPRTTIRFDLSEALRYELSIFDARGRCLRSYEALGVVGGNTVVWDGRDERGQAAPSGTYFYRLHAGGMVSTRKMVLAR